jgi:lipoprotein-anchoring transpeptidase ErfK/SrfK
MRCKTGTALLSAILSLTLVSRALAMEPQEVNQAQFEGDGLGGGQSGFLVKLQVLLDRAHVSPGVIDGYPGENVSKAIRALEQMRGLPVDGELDAELWKTIDVGSDVLVEYQITEEDVADLTESIPEDYSEMAEMDWLGYTSVAERLAERFHMDIELLRSLNANADFKQGERIHVADPGAMQESSIARIEADRKAAQVRAYGENDELLAAYPATVGSRQTPSPSGTHEVVAIAIEPTYDYNPDKNFQQGENTEPLTLPPGPNNPVGLVWIDLSKPTYGVHGTPAPAEIDKEASHGCVRLTNWDAQELGKTVSQGVPVAFIEGD